MAWTTGHLILGHAGAAALMDAMAESWDVEGDATTRSTRAEATFGLRSCPYRSGRRKGEPRFAGGRDRLDGFRAKGGHPRTGGAVRSHAIPAGTRCDTG